MIVPLMVHALAPIPAAAMQDGMVLWIAARLNVTHSMIAQGTVHVSVLTLVLVTQDGTAILIVTRMNVLL